MIFMDIHVGGKIPDVTVGHCMGSRRVLFPKINISSRTAIYYPREETFRGQAMSG